jgi:hypothetical protein
MQACSMQAISAALLKQVQVTDVRCEEVQVAPELVELVPRELCEAERLCPFEKLGGLLCVVMGNPLNRKAISAVEEKAHLKVKSFKAPWPKISELIQRSYGEVAGGEEAPAALLPVEGGVPELTVEELPPALDTGEAVAPLPEVEAPPPEAPVIAPPRPAPVVARRPQPPAPKPAPAGPKIEGLESLDSGQAEVVETTAREVSRRRRAEAVEDEAPPKPEKKAKVNVDLDQLDLTAAEVVPVEEVEEVLEEVPAAAAPAAPVRRAPPVPHGMVRLTTIADGYFYVEQEAPPGERSDELLDLIETLPIAETVAQSIGDYESQKKEKVAATAKAAAPAPRPIEAEPAPAAPAAAVAISEAEFAKETAALVEDPVGEWDWQYAAPGPVAVVAYDET